MSSNAQKIPKSLLRRAIPMSGTLIIGGALVRLNQISKFNFWLIVILDCKVRCCHRQKSQKRALSGSEIVLKSWSSLLQLEMSARRLWSYCCSWLGIYLNSGVITILFYRNEWDVNCVYIFLYFPEDAFLGSLIRDPWP